MAQYPQQDRLIRKEVALGFIRERAYPEDHIGLRIAPFLNVESDDVIFQYINEPSDGLAPARAEDSESELAMHDATFGEGRASVLDWAIKDHYSPSDISKFQDAVYLTGQLGDTIPRSVTDVVGSFNTRIARDTASRVRKLNNRIEWLIQQALWTGSIAYNDGKIIFTTSFGRPAGQTSASVTSWATGGGDPINDILAVQEYMRLNYGIQTTKAITSAAVIRGILASDKFTARSGFAGSANPDLTIDPRYTIDGWGPQAALDVIERSTGVRFEVYDSVYWTGSAGNRTIHRYSPEDKVLFLPADSSVQALDDNIGFAKTLTSPHPEGNWTPGFYEWEKDTGPDPWGYDVGTGIKAFPVFPHLDLSYVLKVN